MNIRAKATRGGQIVAGYYVIIQDKHYVCTGDLCIQEFDSDVGRVAIEVPELIPIFPQTIQFNTLYKDINDKFIYETDNISAFTKENGKEVRGRIICAGLFQEPYIMLPSGAKFTLDELDSIEII